MNLWEREDCLECPPITPKCDCKEGEECQLVQQSCSECAHVICTPTSNGKSTAGPIAGGVIGGLAALGLLVGLYIWWRRKKLRDNAPFEPDMSIMDKGLGPRDTRAYSIESVNTTQDRGSNVIPIAYIPGVTAFSQQQGHIRGSVATSDYRASLPDFVMAVHGQPHLVEIGALKSNNASTSSQYMPQPVGDETHLSPVYDELRVEELTAPSGTNDIDVGMFTNSAKVMTTIVEDPDEEIPFRGYRPLSGASRRSTGPITAQTFGVEPRGKPYIEPRGKPCIEPRGKPCIEPRGNPQGDRALLGRLNSIKSRGPERSSLARYSRNSSVREYNMNIPEEAFLYYNTHQLTEEEEEEKERHR